MQIFAGCVAFAWQAIHLWAQKTKTSLIIKKSEWLHALKLLCFDLLCHASISAYVVMSGHIVCYIERKRSGFRRVSSNHPLFHLSHGIHQRPSSNLQSISINRNLSLALRGFFFINKYTVQDYEKGDRWHQKLWKNSNHTNLNFIIIQTDLYITMH